METIKSLLKAITPPIIISLFRRPKTVDRIGPYWHGNFKTWDAAKSQSTGYEDTDILDKCKTALLKVKNGDAAYERDSIVFDQIQFSWPLLATLERIALENQGNLTVLDFGGSLGSTYYQNKEFLSSVNNLHWCVVEQKHFVDCGKQFFANDQLKFFHTIEQVMEVHKPDVLILSSVLQYLEKPYDWINKFINLEIQYIVIDRTAFVEGDKDILTIQNVPEAIYKASYPAWFFSKKNFAQKFAKAYDIISYFDSGFTDSAVINEVHSVHWEGIIFKK